MYVFAANPFFQHRATALRERDIELHAAKFSKDSIQRSIRLVSRQ